eukprot:TRINITY_DN828_c0_g1_i1.p1 TRINITY_DN828_c0_g1~~TRINITY_DN828_c0_g1_i1.p1  ORF type:complete len:388 (-),score=41.54 TRINITY_DN828_c0_g1_i1:48-1157(-)
MASDPARTPIVVTEDIGSNGYTFSNQSSPQVASKRKGKREKKKEIAKIELQHTAGSSSEATHLHRHFHRQKGERKPYHQKLWKTPKETFVAITQAASKKAAIPIDKLAILGFLSGVYISFGGLFAGSVYLAIPSLDPGLQKLLLGMTFPIALFIIIFLGGELFTGNVMYATAGWLAGTISIKKCCVICITAYISNWLGTAFGAYFFGYLTDLYVHEPWLSGIQKIAVTKTSMGFGVVFLRGVAANWLVNIAIFVVIAAEDISGKTIGLWYPICAFATAGFEHCIANMFFVQLGLMYGAPGTNFGKFIYKNLIPSTLGNILGAAFFVGALSYYVYGWRVTQDVLTEDQLNDTKKEKARQKEHCIEFTCCM